MEVEGKRLMHKLMENYIRLKVLKDGSMIIFNLLSQKICTIVLQLLWHFVHLIISIWHVLLSVTQMLRSYMVSSGLFKKYNALDLNELQCLAIVVENEDAYDISRVIKLLQWLSGIGLKHVCLYDMHGELKKAKRVILQEFDNAGSRELGNDYNDRFLDQKKMIVDFASISDGKEGMAKAADLLCSKYLQTRSSDGISKGPIFTETDISSVLHLVGCEGPVPNLLLTYGSVRCHFGFPAWRMRYTEIVHMGPLKSMEFGALLKTIQEFTMVKQNYGT